MAFAININKKLGSNQYTNSYTYNFNKSIDQYFISGFFAPDNRYHNVFVFTGLRSNGTNLGGFDERNSSLDGNVECFTNSFKVSVFYNYNNGAVGCALWAVIIYPAKYGDVTIS